MTGTGMLFRVTAFILVQSPVAVFIFNQFAHDYQGFRCYLKGCDLIDWLFLNAKKDIYTSCGKCNATSEGIKYSNDKYSTKTYLNIKPT